MRFGEKLSFLRKQHDITQMELAEKLDISRQAVSRWECGLADPSTEKLISIGKLFGVSVDSLVNEDIQIQDGSTVQVAVQECENDGDKSDNVNTRTAKKLIVGCLVTAIIVLAVIVCCFRAWAINQENNDPVSIDELGRVELTDEPSGSFHMDINK